MSPEQIREYIKAMRAWLRGCKVRDTSYHRYAGKMALYERGWTDALIDEHLPPPESRGGDLCRRMHLRPLVYGMNPFWTWATILKIEPTIADKLAMTTYLIQVKSGGNWVIDKAKDEIEALEPLTQ
jgi:hypothetical protein